MGKLVKGARWTERWWRLIVGTIGAIAALVGPYAGSLSDNPVGQIAGLIVGLVGLVVSAVFPLMDKLRAERDLRNAETRARADFLLLIKFSLTPLIQRLAKVVNARRNSRELETEAAGLLQQALGMARQILGEDHKHVRANYFKLDYSLGPSTPRLLAKESTGQAPRDYFDLNSPEGEAVMNMLALYEDVFCSNVKTDPPKGWDPTKPRDYETFLSVTAYTRSGVEPDGMMTVDAPKEGDLKKADLEMLKLIATVVALSESQRNTPS